MEIVVQMLMLVLAVANLVVTLKLLSLIDTIKKYQYTNNLKLLGFIKRELNTTVYQLRGNKNYDRRKNV